MSRRYPPVHQIVAQDVLQTPSQTHHTQVCDFHSFCQNLTNSNQMHKKYAIQKGKDLLSNHVKRQFTLHHNVIQSTQLVHL